MSKETALPKNIRQIGEIQGREKICLEDYVMTCIHKKESQEKEGYLGIFYGEQQETEDSVYVFIRGILEVPVETEPDRVKETLEKQQREYFPGWEVQGCCVIGQYQTDRMKCVMDQMAGSGKLIYHLQEQEETLYWTLDGGYRRMKGYFVFYEQNRKMQQYLADRFQEESVEKESLPDKAIRSFREKVRAKSERKSAGMLRMASSFFVVTVLMIGAVVVTRVDYFRKVQTAFDREGRTVENEVTGDQSRIYMSDTAEVYRDTVNSSDGIAEMTGGAEEMSGGTAEMTGGAVAAGNEIVQGGNRTAMEGGANTDPVTNAYEAPQTDTDPVINAYEAPQTDTDPVTNAYEASQANADMTTNASEASQTDTDLQQTSATPRITQASYTIRAGDTLADICSKYYGSLDKLEDICRTNSIEDANMIMPGQKIVLP